MFNLNLYDVFMNKCGKNPTTEDITEQLKSSLGISDDYASTSFKRAAEVLLAFKNNPIKEFTIVIKGVDPTPAGRPRARVISKNGKMMATVYADPKDKNYRQRVMDIVQDRIDIINETMKQKSFSDTETGLIEGEIHCRLIFNMRMPKANKFLHILGALKIWRPLKKPDNDNLYKLFIDCQQGILFKDDSQFTTTLIEKYYAMEPSIQFKIWYREKPLFALTPSASNK